MVWRPLRNTLILWIKTWLRKFRSMVCPDEKHQKNLQIKHQSYHWSHEKNSLNSQKNSWNQSLRRAKTMRISIQHWNHILLWLVFVLEQGKRLRHFSNSFAKRNPYQYNFSKLREDANITCQGHNCWIWVFKDKSTKGISSCSNLRSLINHSDFRHGRWIPKSDNGSYLKMIWNKFKIEKNRNFLYTVFLK